MKIRDRATHILMTLSFYFCLFCIAMAIITQAMALMTHESTYHWSAVGFTFGGCCAAVYMLTVKLIEYFEQ